MATILKSSTVTPGQFFGYLFMIRDKVHLTHLAQPDRTLAMHSALNDLYEGILDFTDQLIETYQGINNIVKIEIPGSTAEMNAFNLVRGCYDYIQANRGIFPESFLQNILDEISALIAKTLYKLRFVNQ